jgi:hypothetical protein
MGPPDWHLSTNDWAGYATAQWQLSKLAVFSVGLRWEREQMPPPIAFLANPELTTATQTNPQPPLTANLPSLGNNWGPRISLAIGGARDRLPVLRLGYGMYYGRTENATIETALTKTGSLKGDLSFFMRHPTTANTVREARRLSPTFSQDNQRASSRRGRLASRPTSIIPKSIRPLPLSNRGCPPALSSQQGPSSRSDAASPFPSIPISILP